MSGKEFRQEYDREKGTWTDTTTWHNSDGSKDIETKEVDRSNILYDRNTGNYSSQHIDP